MKSKLEKISDILQENIYYTINNKGKVLLQKYYDFVRTIENSIKPFVKEENDAKEIAIHVVSSISSRKIGTEDFKNALRLDTMSSGGKVHVDANRYIFNKDDSILQYLDKAS